MRRSVKDLLVFYALSATLLSFVDAGFSSEVYVGVALIDFIMQVPSTSSNASLDTTQVYQLGTTLTEWIDQQLKASVYANDHSFLHTSYQIMDESIVSMTTSTNGVIKNRVLNGQLDFVYSGYQLDNFDKYWNNVIKTKTDSSILQSLNNILNSYSSSSSSSNSAISSFYFSPCLNTMSQLVSTTVGAQQSPNSILRGLIIATTVLGVCFMATWVYIFCFSSLCVSLKNKCKMSTNLLVFKKGESKEIAPCDTFSTEGSTKVSNIKRQVLGATSKPTYSSKKTNMDNMSQYDMESMSMSPTSKASDSSSVAGRKPLGIISMQALRRLMYYSPRKDKVLMPDHQDPYNMSMNRGEGEDEEGDDMSNQPSPSVKQIEY